MAALSLKVRIVEKDVIKTIQFDPNTTIFDACKIIRDKSSEANVGQPKDYGIFLPDEDPKKGVWLEPGRSLGYYLLRNGDVVDYLKKIRTLKVRMLDGSVKTILVDDSQPVANLMVVICTKIGITNHDEYSLVRETQEEDVDNKSNFGTLTMRRKKDDKDRDSKMEQLKKKIKTDDEMNWVDHSKTLREQGIDESETVLLRRKYFFSDGNVDSHDPVQLNLLYVQARDSILNGTHPVTVDQASTFAGIQCQAQFGDHHQTKHKPGFLDLKEFLPQSYLKVKGVEKKIFGEHKKYAGLSEIEAKVAYVKTARSLSTFGVTFFLVKEKVKGKNKLVPRLLGVTKDSVLRLDEKSKEILKVWPLTTVRRWAASPNTFTLDFGDYSDQYYSVQTTEGEQISQLIAGYIDIILKKKQAKDHFGIEGDEGSTMVEDSVSPHKATIVQHESVPAVKSNRLSTDSVALPAVMRAAESPQPFSTGHSPLPQQLVVQGQAPVSHSPTPQPLISSVLSEPQRALIGTIGEGQRAVSEAETILETKIQVPELGTDSASLKWKQTQLDTTKQNVSSQIAAMNAATASVVTLTSGPAESVDHQAVGVAISTISSNLPEVAKGVKMIAALTEEEKEGDDLVEAARKLCSAFSDLLVAAQPENKDSRQNLLGAASRVGEASHTVLTTIGEETVIDKEVQDILLGLAKAVANTAAALVLQAKGVAANSEDEATRNQVISAATQCALATSQLVACAKVVAPTIEDPACQQHLIAAAREVARAVEAVVAICQQNCKDQRLLGNVNQAAAEVTAALNDLIAHIKDGPRSRALESIHEGAVDSILSASDRLLAAEGDAGEMVRQARVLAQATAQLIQAIKGEAESAPDCNLQQRLLAAARSLAEATARLVEAAKSCASSPNDPEQQLKLRKAAEELRAATNAAAGDALKKKAIKRLETAAKHAAATATQNITAAQAAGHYNTNPATQDQLMLSCRTVAEHVTPMIQGVKGTLANPESPAKQIALVQSCEEFLQVGNSMVAASKAALPTVSDSSSSMQLSSSTKQYAQALIDLNAALSRAREVCGPLDIDWALDILNGLRDELQSFKSAVETSSLKPLPGETAEAAAQHLAVASRSVGSATAQLLTVSSQSNENHTGLAARSLASALQDLTSAARAVAATTNDTRLQHCVIDSTKDVVTMAILLIKEARAVSTSPASAGNQQQMSQAARDLNSALNKCVNCLPGQKDVDDAIDSVNEATKAVDTIDYRISDKSYHELQTMLGTAAVDLNNAAGEVVSTARETPSRLAASSKRYGHSFGQLMGVGVEMAGQTTDKDVRGQMVVSLKNVSMVSTQLLTVAKTVNANPQATSTKTQLSSAARAVTEAINDLVDVCTAAAPGQKECDGAVRAIQSMRPLLENVTEPISDETYFGCLETVMEKSKDLGDGMTGIANSVKQSEYEAFGNAVRNVAGAICGLLEAAAQSAYLVGVSEASSVTARSGLIDQAAFAHASNAIETSCQVLCNRSSTQQQALSAATIIAKHTSTLCNACRAASSKTSSPVAKRQFVQSAKDVANATANLVKEIKDLDQDYSQQRRENCAAATKPLLEAVENLCAYANSPEFASVPARISGEGRQQQEPILSAAKSIIEGSCSMILAAKALAVNPKDPPAWQDLANHSKGVSESIKRIVSAIRDAAPGQKDCDKGLAQLSLCLRQLNQVYSDAVSQNLQPRKDKSLQGFAEQISNCILEISHHVDPVRAAAEGEAEKLGHSVTQMVNYFEPLVISATGWTSHLLNSKQQTMLLDQTKTVAECALQLVYAAKEAGGNPQATHIHGELNESTECMKISLRELLSTVETVSAEAGIVSGLVDTITTAMNQMEYNMATMDRDNISFSDYQARITALVKEILQSSQQMVEKSGSRNAEVGPLAAGISHKYTQLSLDTRRWISRISSVETSSRIKYAVRDLGQSCIDFIKAAGVCQSLPGDSYAQQDLSHSSKILEEKAYNVLAALQAKGMAVPSAASTVSGIIGDLDTTILFATAGTLNEEILEGSGNREDILKTAKALIEDTKTLVAGAAASQQQLATAAQNAVATIVQLAEAAQSGSAADGSSITETQTLLFDAVKDVVAALGDLIHTTKPSSNNYTNHVTPKYPKYPPMSDCDFDGPGIITDTEHSDWLVSDQEEEPIRLLTTDSDFAEADIASRTIQAH